MFPISCNAVGDIITLASIVADIARALSDTRGSIMEYRAFTEDLDTMHATLVAISRIAESCSDDRLRQRVVREVSRCWNDIQTALESVAKFSALDIDEDSVRQTGFRDKFQRQWFKLEWRFLKRAEVQEFQDKFRASMHRLNAFSGILNKYVGFICTKPVVR